MTPMTLSGRLALVAAPVLLAVGTALVPAGVGDRHGDDVAKSLAVLDKVAPHRDLLPWSILLICLGLGLMILAGAVLASLSGGPVAKVGAVLVTIGASSGIAGNATTPVNLYRLTDPGLDRHTAARVLAFQNPIVFFGILLFLLMLVGLIILAVSAWRAGAFPGWVAALIGVGALIGFFAGEGVAGGVATIPLIAGMFLAGRGRGSGSRTALATA